MGFLDGLFGDLDDPKKQAMLTMAMGLLSGAPGQRKNFGADLGHAGLLGMGAYGSAKSQQAKLAEEAQQKEMRAMQMEQMKQQQARQMQIQGLPGQFNMPGNLTPNDDQGNAMPSAPTGFNREGYANALEGIDPQQALAYRANLAAMGAKERKTVKPGETLGTYVNGKFVSDYSAPDKLPTGMRMGANGPEFIPEYLVGQQQIRASGRPVVDVRVNTEKTYSGSVAEGLAKQDVAVIDAARSAPDRIAAARRVRDVLTQSPITGTGATWRLGAEKAFATAGIIDGERVKSTENLAAELASATLDAIKTSGLGSGQGFTDKDRQFLEKARAGNLEINHQTLGYLADLNERAGVASINRGNTVIRRLRGNKSMGEVGTSLDEVSMPTAPERPPAATIRRPPSQAGSIDDLVKFYTNPRR